MPFIDPDEMSNDKFIDPDEINQGADQQQLPKNNYWQNPVSRGLADVVIGMGKGGQGLHNALYNITKAGDWLNSLVGTNPHYAEGLPQFMHPVHENLGAAFGVAKPGLADQLVQDLGQYGPYSGLSSATMGGQAAAGALAGATQSDNPILGVPLGAPSFALPTTIFKGAKSFIDAPKLYKSLEKTLSEGNVEAVKKSGGKVFQNIIEPLKNHTIINDLKDQNKIMAPLEKLYEGKRSLPGAYKNFVKNPTVNNAHSLQHELGEHIGDIKSKKAKGTRSEEERLIAQKLGPARETLLKGLNDYLDKTAPEISGAYKQAQANWRNNVQPIIDLGRDLENYNARQFSPKQIVKKLYYTINKSDANPYISKTLRQVIEDANSAFKVRQKAAGIGLLSSAALGTPHLLHKFMGVL